MATTKHGHHIPGSSTGNDDNSIPKARCGGPRLCKECEADAEGMCLDFGALEMHIRRVRKRPIEVEAIKWTEGVPMAVLIKFTDHLVRLNDVDKNFQVFDRLHNRWIPFKYGDWIIKGVKGEFYPCDGEVFKETYEDVAL